MPNKPFEDIIREEGFDPKEIKKIREEIRKSPEYTYNYSPFDNDPTYPSHQTVTAGSDGVTEDMLILMALWDRRELKEKQRALEHEDPRVDKLKVDEKIDSDEMAIDILVGSAKSQHIHDLRAVNQNEEKPNDWIVELVQGIIRTKLTEKQRDSIYAYYGERKTLDEIAKSEHISKVAAFKRVHSAENKVSKHLLKCGVTEDQINQYGFFTHLQKTG